MDVGDVLGRREDGAKALFDGWFEFLYGQVRVPAVRIVMADGTVGERVSMLGAFAHDGWVMNAKADTLAKQTMKQY